MARDAIVATHHNWLIVYSRDNGGQSHPALLREVGRG